MDEGNVNKNNSRESAEHKQDLFFSSDEEGPDICDSGFISRAYDLGFRETLREDYPEQEEEGRSDGFSAAFGGLGEKKKEKESPADFVKKFAHLEGVISLLLVKFQAKMSERQLREIVALRNEIKEQISKLNTPPSDERLKEFAGARKESWASESVENVTEKTSGISLLESVAEPPSPTSPGKGLNEAVANNLLLRTKEIAAAFGLQISSPTSN